MGNACLLTSDSSLWLRPSRITPHLPESQLLFLPSSLAGLKKWLQLVLLLWVPSLDNKILKLLPVIMNEIVAYSLWRLVSLCCASSRWLQPWSLALSIFSTESVTIPLPSNLIGFLFFSWMAQISKRREVVLHFLSSGQGRDHTAHIFDALGRRLPSHSDLQLFDTLEVDNELVKPVLKHLLCKPGTCRLASHFEIWYYLASIFSNSNFGGLVAIKAWKISVW